MSVGRICGRLAAFGAAVLVVSFGSGSAWAYRDDHQGHGHVPVDARSGERLYGCENALDHGPHGNLVKHTDPPDGAAVAAGQEITVELSWHTEDWDASVLHKVLDCVTVDARLSYALTGGEKPTTNDGHFSHRYTIPADAPPGTVVCDVGFLSGPSGNEEFAPEESQRVCFTVERPPSAPPLPPAPPVETQMPAPPVKPQLSADQSVPTVLPAPLTRMPPRVTPAVLPRTGAGPEAGRLGTPCRALAGLTRLARRRTR